MAGLVVAAVALSGCSSLGARSFGDSTTTGAVTRSAPGALNQPMPASLGAPPNMQVAEQQFLPPANVGSAWGGAPAQSTQPAQSGIGGFAPATGATSPIGMAATTARPSVQSQDLPVLSSSSSMGTPAMPAQSSLPAATPAPSAVAMTTPTASSTLPVNSAVPVQAPAANTNGYRHTIASGESLYTIARKYDVTTQSIVQANGLSSPDRIVVGQQIVIPGRTDLIRTPQAPASTLPATPTTQVASATPMAAPTPAAKPLQAAGANVLQTAATPTPAPAATPAATPVAAAPTQVASTAAPAATPAAVAQPAVTSDKFAWPVAGRVITDFAASRGTGINIDVPEGSSVKAAETGTVIYVGSGVEGYGNLILIRHPNGYVSAYAHLADMSVAKGASVSRGQAIGTVGKTGSVSKPQLHFELRKGATPVDPVPLLAS